MANDRTTYLSGLNGQLSESDVERALQNGENLLWRCGIEAKRVTTAGLQTAVIGNLGDHRFLVYVRVTHGMHETPGTGPLPQVVVDAARSLDASPFVIRIDIRPMRVGQAFAYWGGEDVEQAIKSHTEEWNRFLLRGRTVKELLDLCGGHVSELTLCNGPMVFVDDVTIRPGGFVDIKNLADSCLQSEEYYIFNCHCGYPQCAGIKRGIVVAHDAGLTAWKAYSARPSRVFVFDTGQYVTEIRRSLQEFLDLVERAVGYEAEWYEEWVNLDRLRQTLCELRKLP